MPEKGSDPSDWKALQKALGEAMAVKDLKELGKRGHELVEQKYTWSAVVKPVVKGYGALLHD